MACYKCATKSDSVKRYVHRDAALFLVDQEVGDARQARHFHLEKKPEQAAVAFVDAEPDGSALPELEVANDLVVHW